MLQSDLPAWLVWTTVLLLGLCFGSFLNVVVYRLPRELSLSHPGSTCPGCNAKIAPYHNVPVLGWLFLRGRAACCGTKISVRYPLVELAGGLVAALLCADMIARFSDAPIELFSVLFLARLALGLSLIALALIDLEFMLLPDSLTLGSALVGITLARFGLSPISLAESLDASLVGFFIVWFPFIYLHEKWRGFPGMGLGDAKLVLAAGAWFGWFGILFTLFAGAIQGTLITLGLSLVGHAPKEPEAITREREEIKRAIAEAEGEEREALEKELERDPALREIAEGTYGSTRIAFGPFLVLALLELLFLEPILRSFVLGFLWGGS